MGTTVGAAIVSHQTVTLARGPHSSPDEGVCVMELASMLAGEPFSDQPRSVCPVIGAFLRAYNDRLDDCRRQDLYAYAALVVGTRSTAAVECRRAHMCREAAERLRRSGASPEPPPPPSGQPRRLRARFHGRRREYAGRRAASAFVRGERGHGDQLDEGAHRDALRFVDELIAEGRYERPWSDDARTRHGRPRPARV